MKRKIIVAILAVTVIVSTLAAPLAQVFAAENDKDITGTWTGSSMGIPMEMTVNDDGTYQISVDGGNKETGSWVLKDKDFIMDMDSDYELNMKYNGDSIFVDSSDIDIGFCKTPANVKTDEQKTDVSESDFNGVWKVDTVEFEKLAAGPDAFGITDMFADIKNGYVNLYITGTNISDPVKLNDIQAELNSKTGTITFDIPKDEATNEVTSLDNKCTFSIMDSGILKMDLMIDGQEMIFNMKKSSKDELRTAKNKTTDTDSTAGNTEENGSPTIQSIVDYINDTEESENN